MGDSVLECSCPDVLWTNSCPFMWVLFFLLLNFKKYKGFSWIWVSFCTLWVYVNAFYTWLFDVKCEIFAASSGCWTANIYYIPKNKLPQKSLSMEVVIYICCCVSNKIDANKAGFFSFYFFFIFSFLLFFNVSFQIFTILWQWSGIRQYSRR